MYLRQVVVNWVKYWVKYWLVYYFSTQAKKKARQLKLREKMKRRARAYILEKVATKPQLFFEKKNLHKIEKLSSASLHPLPIGHKKQKIL